MKPATPQFVSYRAGAFAWLKHSLGVSNPVPAAPEFVTTDEIPAQLMSDKPGSSGKQMFYSSKSGAVFIDVDSASPNTIQPALPSEQQAESFLSGSKTLLPSPPRAKPAIPPGSKAAAGS